MVYTARNEVSNRTMPIDGNQIKDAIALGFKVYKLVEVEVTDPDAEVAEWEAAQAALLPVAPPPMEFPRDEEA